MTRHACIGMSRLSPIAHIVRHGSCREMTVRAALSASQEILAGQVVARG